MAKPKSTKKTAVKEAKKKPKRERGSYLHPEARSARVPAGR
jgi:hypothetical protein